jgi:tetratricopeptide (TPR) repeat protein
MADYERAAKALTDWQAKVPKASPEIDRSRGELAAARRKWPEAIEAWRRYLSSVPNDEAMWMELASAYGSTRAWDEAVQAVSKAIELSASAERLSQRARYRIRLHDWTAAEADAREADRLDATDGGARALLPVFERAAQWIGPVTRLDASIAKDPENPQLRLDRAEWLIGIGFTDAGTDDVDIAFEKAPTSLRARLWHGLLAWHRGDKENVGNVIEMQLTDVDASFERELRALEKASTPEERAAFLMRHKQPVLALEEVSKLDGSPSKVMALLTLDRLTEAGAAARRSVEMNPGDSTAWIALARVEIANGNINEALGTLQRSLRIKKTTEGVALLKQTERRLGRK